jgi:pimeloyl-ACP methyl ester carboxylesterase
VRALTAPTLLVRGTKSDVLSAEGVEHFVALCPHAQTIDVAGAAHMVAGDRNDLFGDAMRGFLDRALGRG